MQWEGERLGVAVRPGDCRENPLNCPIVSSGNSSAEVMLPPPHRKPSHVPLGTRVGKLHITSSGLREAHSSKVVCQKAQLKCLYTHAHSIGNKQEELETVMCLENYSPAAMTEMWWDDSHNWNTTVEGYHLFRRG